MFERKRVAIVGAGASGLAAARHALLYDFEPVVFEGSQHIGGLWHFKPEDSDEGSVMKSTVINTSKEMTAYSDFPPPADFANFMHNRKLLDYFTRYAQHYDLEKHIRFGRWVKNVRRSDTYPETGKWIVEYKHCEKIEEEEFDGVLLCTGHHTKPFWPASWPGQQSFKGRITHAHSYKDHHGFDDQVVAVVGVGNSGIDIAVELSRIAKQIYLVTRRGTWVFHRNLDHSIPFDLPLNTRFVALLSSIVPTCVASKYMQMLVEKRLDHEKFGLKPKHGVLSAHLTVNDELPNRLSCGTIIVKPNIREFTESGVIFEDERRVDLDHVILSTGYSFEFPLAEAGTLIPVVDNDVSLYLNMYPVETADHNSLAVIGLIQPLGSIMPISEMQARVFFEALSGKIKLPRGEKMRKNIQSRRSEMHKRYVESRRHTIQVDYCTYMDELAELIDCKPQPALYLFTDPILAYRLMFGPNAPYVYRLRGPHSWSGARDAILSIDDRVLEGMHSSTPKSVPRIGSKTENKKSKSIYAILQNFVIFLLSFTIVFWIYAFLFS